MTSAENRTARDKWEEEEEAVLSSPSSDDDGGEFQMMDVDDNTRSNDAPESTLTEAVDGEDLDTQKPSQRLYLFYVPQGLHINDLSCRCDNPIPTPCDYTISDLRDTPCCKWLKSKKKHTIPSLLDPSQLPPLHAAQTTGILRFYYQNKEYSPRTLAYLMMRGKELPSENLNIRILRFSQLCHNPLCINPWHQTFSGTTKRSLRYQASAPSKKKVAGKKKVLLKLDGSTMTPGTKLINRRYRLSTYLKSTADSSNY